MKPKDWKLFKDNYGLNSSFPVGSGNEFHIHQSSNEDERNIYDDFNGPASLKNQKTNLAIKNLTPGDALWRSGTLEYYDKFINEQKDDFLKIRLRLDEQIEKEEEEKERYDRMNDMYELTKRNSFDDYNSYSYSENIDTSIPKRIKLPDLPMYPSRTSYPKLTKPVEKLFPVNSRFIDGKITTVDNSAMMKCMDYNLY